MAHPRLVAACLALACVAPPAAAERPPAVTVGPALYEAAAAVLAPIDDVTVYSDRARITRVGAAEGAVGVRALRLPDLPGTTLLDTVRLSAEGAEVLRVEAAPVDRAVEAVGDTEGLVAAIEAQRAALARLDARRAVLLGELTLLVELGPTAVPEDREKAPPVDPAGWAAARRFLADRRADLVARVAALDDAQRVGREALAKAQAELTRHDAGAATDVRRVQVLAVVRATRARPTLRLSYFVPGAHWRPAYTVELADGGQQVTVRAAARVKQTTGEDWTDVALALSTAIPAQGIEAPRLLTWTLGESRDFLPQPRAERDPAPPTFAAPTPAPRLSELRRAAADEALRARLSAALNEDDGEADRDADGLADAIEGVGRGVGAVGDAPSGYGRGAGAVALGRVSRPQPSAAPRPMDFEADAVSGEMSRAPGPAYVRTPLDLFDAPAPSGPRITDATLPAALAGGLDHVYEAVTRASVPSGKDVHTVPIDTATWPVTTHYEAAPALRLTAYRTATVKNPRATPLLAGPVDIFVGADYVGSGALETTGPGGTLSLPLGADEDIRLVRRVLPKTVTEGVFSKTAVTRYVTEVDVANDKRRPVTVRVVEQYPLGGISEDVEVKREAATPKPAFGPDAAGRVVFEVQVPPGEVRTLRLAYRIERPADHRLYQR